MFSWPREFSFFWFYSCQRRGEGYSKAQKACLLDLKVYKRQEHGETKIQEFELGLTWDIAPSTRLSDLWLLLNLSESYPFHLTGGRQVIAPF